MKWDNHIRIYPTSIDEDVARILGWNWEELPAIYLIEIRSFPLCALFQDRTDGTFRLVSLTFSQFGELSEWYRTKAKGP
jgi:hypothetical protein